MGLCVYAHSVIDATEPWTRRTRLRARASLELGRCPMSIPGWPANISVKTTYDQHRREQRGTIARPSGSERGPWTGALALLSADRVFGATETTGHPDTPARRLSSLHLIARGIGVAWYCCRGSSRLRPQATGRVTLPGGTCRLHCTEYISSASVVVYNRHRKSPS